MRKFSMTHAWLDSHTWPSTFPEPTVSVFHWPCGHLSSPRSQGPCSPLERFWFYALVFLESPQNGNWVFSKCFLMETMLCWVVNRLRHQILQLSALVFCYNARDGWGACSWVLDELMLLKYWHLGESSRCLTALENWWIFRASKRNRMLPPAQNADTHLCQLPITILCLSNGDEMQCQDVSSGVVFL